MSKKASPRSEKGISLVTVMLIGMVSTMWLGALFSSVMPTFNRITQTKQDFTLRNTAEMAIDWAIEQLNTQGLGAGIDVAPQTADNGYKETSVPYGNLVSGGALPVSARVIVRNSQPLPGSSLYDSNTYYPPALNGAVNPANGLTRNYWRVVDAIAQTNTTPIRRMRIRVILRPNMTAATQTNVSPTAGIKTDGAVEMAPNYVTNSYFSGQNLNPAANGFTNSRGDVLSNGEIKVGNGTIGGHAVSYRFPAEGAGITTGPNGRVEGKARANSTISLAQNQIGGNMPAGASSDPNQEKLHLADKSIQNMNPQMSKFTLQAPPSHPPAAQPLAGGGTLSNTITINGPGEYYLNKIDLTGNKTITIGGNGPVKIWIEGAGASLNLGGQAKFQNNSGKPENLQIFFPGSGSISMGGGSQFRGVIYAPQADLTLNGGAQIYGAIIGKSVNFNGGGNSGALHYDTALDQIQLFSVSTSTTFQNFTVVSWQELPDYLP